MRMFPVVSTILLSAVPLPGTSDAVRLGGGSAPISRHHHHHHRVLESFFCFLGDCDDDTNNGSENATNSTPQPVGDTWCVPLLGPCPEQTTTEANRDYTECTNRTDGLFGGRPIFGDCGYVTEVVDNVVGSTDTDGDGRTDAIQLDIPERWQDVFTPGANGTTAEQGSSNGTTTTHGWLQLFPEGSLMWNIFGPEADVNSTRNATAEVTGFIDRAVDTLFGDDSNHPLSASFRPLTSLLTQFASEWEPVYGNGTCVPPPASFPPPVALDINATTTTANASTATLEDDTIALSNTTVATTAPPPPEYQTCRTPFGRDGFYVCRTLYNPYTGVPQNKTLCLDDEAETGDDGDSLSRSGMMMPHNDVCGCCGGVCPEERIAAECQCRCNLHGINDGLLIVSARLDSTQCVSRDDGIATVGQQLDVQCSTACLQSSTPLATELADGGDDGVPADPEATTTTNTTVPSAFTVSGGSTLEDLDNSTLAAAVLPRSVDEPST